jgi:DNA-binding response OmpR family regulator
MVSDDPYQSESAAVLIVEDSFVGGFLRSALTQKGYEVVCAGADDALTMLGDPQKRVALLITNSPAPFSGFPQLPVLYLAAVPEPEPMRAFEHCRVLRKPFHPAQLFASIRELLP